MKNFIIAFVTIALFGFTTMAQNGILTGKTYTIANPAISKSLPAEPAPFSCSCACGKDCEGGCSGPYWGCSSSEAFTCIVDCCDSAPSPGTGECGIRY